VWHAAFGAAYAHLILTPRPPPSASVSLLNDVSPELVSRAPHEYAGITQDAQYLAQAAVLEYRRISS
jgi:hypothetical protein